MRAHAKAPPRTALWLLALTLALPACREDDPAALLQAKQVETLHDLIGGPLAHGQVGDFVIENDQVRFIISGAHHSWGPGLFGGTVVDADVRRFHPLFRGREGNDQFAELFPTVNLLVPDPKTTQITVTHDGSDGQMAQIRVGGTGLMYLEALEILIPDNNGDTTAKALANSDVQTVLDFVTTYTLRPGDRYLEIETTVMRPDDQIPHFSFPQDRCDDALEGCTLDCGGRYRSEPFYAQPPKDYPKAAAETGCLKCECDEGLDLQPYSEPIPLLGSILGDDFTLYTGPDKRRPGLVGGDFLFFGGGTKIFAPGLGFDSKGQIFQNLFRGVDTITSPLTFDWLASVGTDVSYIVFARYENRPDVCQHRVVLTRMLQPDKRDELSDLLVAEYGKVAKRLNLAIDNLIEQRIPLSVEGGVAEADLAARVEAAQQTLGALAEVGTEPDGACRDAKLLVPLLTSSATMVASSGGACLQGDISDDAACDEHRMFRFTRFLAVGEGDVSSVASSVYHARGQETGRVTGVVFDSRLGTAQHRAEVFALQDPDPSATFETYDALVRANLEATTRTGVANQALADVGTDPRRNGSYNLTLPPGSWFVVPRSHDGVLGRPVRVQVSAGGTTVANLVVDPPALLDFQVLAGAGGLTPAKLTLQALDPTTGALMYADGKRRVELGPSRMDDAIFKVVYSATGEGQIAAEPGRYRIVVSRGPEYSIDTQDVELRAGEVASLSATIHHEVDTSGWISGDFHLHAEASQDSGMTLPLRVITNVVEGVELLSSSDHDGITDYLPALLELGLDAFASTQIGTEVTTLEMGHTLGFPLKYNANDQPVHGAVDWVCQRVEETWRDTRALGELGPAETVITVAHPRDGFFGYFDQFGLNPWTGQRAADLSLEDKNPLLRTVSCDFDSIELMNGKRFELIRTPTVVEINDSEDCLEEINAALTNSQVRDACAFLRQPAACAGGATEYRGEPCSWYGLADEGFQACTDDDLLGVCKDKARNAATRLIIRRILTRTPDEQHAWVNATAAQRDPEQTLCAPKPRGKLKDDFVWTLADEIAPCAQHQGVADDWFTLLNYDVAGRSITAMGNSDSHGTTLEPGIPRNWIASSTDDVRKIDRAEIARNIHQNRVVVSTGPFVRVEIGEATIGDTVALTDGQDIQLRIQVQTPSWFGVSRVEIYRNRQLVEVLAADQPASAIVDLDQVVTLPHPGEDSWYVVAAFGLRDEDFLAPVYHTVPLGELSLDKITSLAFANLGAVASVLDPSSKVPDYFPSIPYAMTNPIWVDADGDGYHAPSGPAPFCPIPCKPKVSEMTGNLLQSDCPQTVDTECVLTDVDGDPLKEGDLPETGEKAWAGQCTVCLPNETVGGAADGGGTCGIPVVGECGLGELIGADTKTGALTVGPGARPGLPEPWQPPAAAPRSTERLRMHTVGRILINAFAHGFHHHVE